nr:cysteine-rich receptor-like protein kinase 2 [Tanacetum cinerariifolium]
VLEILSGRRCTEVPAEFQGEQCLLEHLVDATLDPSDYKEEDIKKILGIALMCTQSPVSVRPTMSEVVMLLSDRSRVQNLPSRQNVSFTDLSNADATITELTGRFISRLGGLKDVMPCPGVIVCVIFSGLICEA